MAAWTAEAQLTGTDPIDVDKLKHDNENNNAVVDTRNKNEEEKSKSKLKKRIFLCMSRFFAVGKKKNPFDLAT